MLHLCLFTSFIKSTMLGILFQSLIIQETGTFFFIPAQTKREVWIMQLQGKRRHTARPTWLLFQGRQSWGPRDAVLIQRNYNSPGMCVVVSKPLLITAFSTKKQGESFSTTVLHQPACLLQAIGWRCFEWDLHKMHPFLFLLVMDCSLRDCWQCTGFRVYFIPPTDMLGNIWRQQIRTGFLCVCNKNEQWPAVCCRETDGPVCGAKASRVNNLCKFGLHLERISGEKIIVNRSERELGKKMGKGLTALAFPRLGKGSSPGLLTAVCAWIVALRLTATW